MHGNNLNNLDCTPATYLRHPDCSDSIIHPYQIHRVDHLQIISMVTSSNGAKTAYPSGVVGYTYTINEIHPTNATFLDHLVHVGIGKPNKKIPVLLCFFHALIEIQVIARHIFVTTEKETICIRIIYQEVTGRM